MAAKKTAKRPRPKAPGTTHEMKALRRIAETLSSHEAAIRQLAEVVVNLHENVRALRDVAEALGDGPEGRRVVGAIRRLRRVKLPG